LRWLSQTEHLLGHFPLPLRFPPQDLLPQRHAIISTAGKFSIQLENENQIEVAKSHNVRPMAMEKETPRGGKEVRRHGGKVGNGCGAAHMANGKAQRLS